MIDKLTPKFLDKSSDYKLVRKTSLIDALNIYIDTETGDDNSGGVIKPIKGTQVISINENDSSLLENTAYKAIGSVTDDNTGIVYFFVWSENVNQHGIWAYDSRGVLPVVYEDEALNEIVYEPPVAGKIRKIITSSSFNFSSDGFVKGDVVYTNTREFDKYDQLSGGKYPEKDAILYFTDNKNEPRKVNVYRALLAGFNLVSGSSAQVQSLNRQIKNDFICACPRVPMLPPEFEFVADPDVKINNFLTVPGFQFAYQNVYQDGSESAISPYSDIAFPPSILEKGASKSDNSLSDNKCIIRVPPQNQEVVAVKILARYGNSSNFVEIDEVSHELTIDADYNPGEVISYDFLNNKVFGGVSPQTVDKTFDNVPQKAQSQVATSNRMAYGNYVEGYDNVDCSGVNLSPVYLDRPSEILSFEIEIKESMEMSQNVTLSGDISEDDNFAVIGQNKMGGFTYKRNQFPDAVGAGTRIRVSFSMSPDKNFHIYNGGQNYQTGYGEQRISYHQSKHLGSHSFNLPGYGTGMDGEPLVNDTSSAQYQENGLAGEPAHMPEEHAGAGFLSDFRENYFGFNDGVGPTQGQQVEQGNRWETVIDTREEAGGVVGGSPAGEKKIVYGTSAANPLIIQGGNIPFFVDFTINTELASGARNVIGTAFEYLLSGRTDNDVNEELQSENLVTSNDVKRSHDLEINLGLSDYSQINPGTPLSNLICGAFGYDGTGVSNPSYYMKEQPPKCAFIVNRATATFYLESVKKTTDQNPEYRGANSPGAFRLGLAKIEVPDSDAVMTCVRDLDPSSPWWAITPSTMENELPSNFNSIVQNQLSPVNRVFHPNTESPKRNFVGRFPTSYKLQQDGYQFVPFGTYGFGGPNVDVNTGDSYTGAGGEELVAPGMGNLYANPDILSVDENASFRTTMAMCFGYMKLQQGDNLLGEEVDINDIDVRGEFKYSLVDGEGGPGGSGAGSGTAYDVLGNDKYGSLAAQCFVDKGLTLGRPIFTDGFLTDYNPGGSSLSALNGAINHKPSEGYNVYAAGSTSGEIGNTALTFLRRGGLAGVINGGDLPTLEGNVPDGSYEHTSVLCGPFYTGRIVMNNFNGENLPDANINPAGTSIPDGRNDTTTLPLVWFSSWTRGTSDYLGEESTATSHLPNVGTGDDREDRWIQSSWQIDKKRQTWYPHPIVVGGEDATGGFVDGALENGELVPDPFGAGYNSVDYSLNQSHIEMREVGTTFEDETRGSGASFKSSASHDFGIVYYDERGRHGYVNPIGSVYVAGYNPQDRSENAQGAVNIKLSNITHTPPSWAEHYKVVYSKNTTVDKFVQYSAGGAFVRKTTSDNDDASIIYVSLNYLQGHPISYSDSYGARGRDNTPVMYSFTPGDRLRVISYFLSADGDNISRNFPSNAEFEVTGLFSFDENDNPFVEAEGGDVEVLESMKGLFVGLRNNQDAQGFRYEDVRDENDLWGDNCIFEIFSPRKQTDADDRLYYEIGPTYPIVFAGSGEEGETAYFHKFDEITVTQGDVFFRKHAVNLRKYSINGFVDLLEDTGDEDEVFVPDSNFQNYYLESEAATDLFPSRALSIGRPNIIKSDARQSRRESSIVHSDKDIIEARKLGYSSFNRSIPSDLEIDIKAGAVNYMTNHQDAIFFVQKNKCGHIPVDRNLISDTAGTSSLIASSKFLGTPRYYAGQAGCDDNPESVVDVDNTAYFAHKSMGKVFKVSGANGVNVISDNNMSTFIRNAFRDATANLSSVRVLGGYDPLKKEYLLTITENDPTLTFTPEGEIVDEDTFVPSSEMGEDVAIEFDGGIISDEDDVEEQRFPEIRIDWSLASNLNNAEWNLNYSAGDINNQGANNLNTQYSSWKTKPDGLNVNIADENLALRIHINNRDLFEVDDFVFALDKNTYDTLSIGPGFDLKEEDASDVALVREKIAEEAINGIESGQGLEDILGPESQFPSCFKYGTPVIPEAVANNVYWMNNGFLGINIQDLPNDAPTSFYIDIPIIAVSNVDNNLLRQSWFIGNMNFVRLVRESAITLSSDVAFKVGTTSNNNTSRTLPLKSTITWALSDSYVEQDSFVGVDVDGEEELVIVPFNICNPYYGFSAYTDENGVLSDSASDIVNAWYSDGGMVSWLETEGVDPSDTDIVSLITSIINAINPYIGTGEPLGCLTSNLETG